MLNDGRYILASLRYTGDILDELIKRAENFKLEEDRAEFMINQAYRYFPVYDIKVKKTESKEANSSIRKNITDCLVEMYGEDCFWADEIVLDEAHKLKNETYWIKIGIECDKEKGLKEVINSGNRLVLIKFI